MTDWHQNVSGYIGAIKNQKLCSIKSLFKNPTSLNLEQHLKYEEGDQGDIAGYDDVYG